MKILLFTLLGVLLLGSDEISAQQDPRSVAEILREACQQNHRCKLDENCITRQILSYLTKESIIEARQKGGEKGVNQLVISTLLTHLETITTRCDSI